MTDTINHFSPIIIKSGFAEVPEYLLDDHDDQYTRNQQNPLAVSRRYQVTGDGEKQYRERQPEFPELGFLALSLKRLELLYCSIST